MKTFALYFLSLATLSTGLFAKSIEYKEDEYKGIIVEVNSRAENFQQELADSLAQWKKDSKRGVWLTIPIEYSDLVPAAVKEGFVFHHAREDKLVLTKWLPENEQNMLPAYATHTVGVSAIVIDDQKMKGLI